MLSRIARAIITPSKWSRIAVRVRLLAHNVVRYRTFSLNPNTRRYWNGIFQECGDFWRDENYRHLLDLLPPDQNFSLLDIGCALGNGCELLQQTFPKAQIAGTDISETGIAKANARHGKVNYFVLDILKQPIPGDYDYILIIETLEHFDNPFPVVESCLKHARKAVFISVPYRPEPGNLRLEMSEHRYSFDEETFARYHARVARVTDFVAVTQDRCIIYELKP